jgi:Protein of unknown function (DUF4231)
VAEAPDVHPHGELDPGKSLREREWLKRSWRATAELIQCDVCLPDLSPQQREKMRLRWLVEARHYDSLWRHQRFLYYALRIPLIVGGVTVTTLAGLGAGELPTALAGGAVTVLTGLEALFNLGPRWHTLRQTYHQLEEEGWAYIDLVGPYRNEGTHPELFDRFLHQVEAINATQSESYLGLFREGTGDRPDGAAKDKQQKTDAD